MFPRVFLNSRYCLNGLSGLPSMDIGHATKISSPPFLAQKNREVLKSGNSADCGTFQGQPFRIIAKGYDAKDLALCSMPARHRGHAGCDLPLPEASGNVSVQNRHPPSIVNATPNLSIVGASGVDLFFVISGFIMAYITCAQRGPHAILPFLKRRLVRIVPLYWFFTLIMAGLLLFFPNLFRPHILTAEDIAFPSFHSLQFCCQSKFSCPCGWMDTFL